MDSVMLLIWDGNLDKAEQVSCLLSSSMVNAIEILFAYGEIHCWPYVSRVGFVRHGGEDIAMLSA
mgnify:CR=1 FL=1